MNRFTFSGEQSLLSVSSHTKNKEQSVDIVT